MEAAICMVCTEGTAHSPALEQSTPEPFAVRGLHPDLQVWADLIAKGL